MPIPFVCPACHHRGFAPDSQAGKGARCRCGHTLLLPREPVPGSQVPPGTGRRSELDRRLGADRRQRALPFTPPDRRQATDRRLGGDRRGPGAAHGTPQKAAGGQTRSKLPWIAVGALALVAGVVFVASRGSDAERVTAPSKGDVAESAVAGPGHEPKVVVQGDADFDKIKAFLSAHKDDPAACARELRAARKRFEETDDEEDIARILRMYEEKANASGEPLVQERIERARGHEEAERFAAAIAELTDLPPDKDPLGDLNARLARERDRLGACALGEWRRLSMEARELAKERKWDEAQACVQRGLDMGIESVRVEAEALKGEIETGRKRHAATAGAPAPPVAPTPPGAEGAGPTPEELLAGLPPSPAGEPLPCPLCGSLASTSRNCPLCLGNARLQCDFCNGQGRVDCPNQGAYGLSCEEGYIDWESTDVVKGSRGPRDKCEVCDGKGALRCPKCGGQGTWTCPTCRGKATLPWVCPISGSRTKIHWTTEEGACALCRGTQTLACSPCKGSGRLAMPPCEECGGSNKKPCVRCKTTGRTACSECLGTGKVRYVSATNGTNATQTQCRTCEGDGWRACAACQKGAIACPRCGAAGKGDEECRTCAGSGKRACAFCAEGSLWAGRTESGAVVWLVSAGHLLEDLGTALGREMDGATFVEERERDDIPAVVVNGRPVKPPPEKVTYSPTWMFLIVDNAGGADDVSWTQDPGDLALRGTGLSPILRRSMVLKKQTFDRAWGAMAPLYGLDPEILGGRVVSKGECRVFLLACTGASLGPELSVVPGGEDPAKATPYAALSRAPLDRQSRLRLLWAYWKPECMRK